jgi:arylformamidase
MPNMSEPSDGHIFRGMNQEQLDAAYNNLAAVPGSAGIISGWAAPSEKIRKQPGARLDIAYGAAPRARLDYFPCGAPDAPLFVFIHGGYWLRNHKDMFAFAAEGPLAAGFDVAMAGYTLAPEARLTTMVEEIDAALTHLAEHTDDYGFRRDRLIVGGWSAGGHLAAMMLDHPAVHGVLAISGIFELEPVSLCYVNDVVQLSAEEVARLSPIRLLKRRSVPITLLYGAEELPELRRQSTGFAEAAQVAGQPVRAAALTGHNHFTILDELRTPDGRIVEALRQLI